MSLFMPLPWPVAAVAVGVYLEEVCGAVANSRPLVSTESHSCLACEWVAHANKRVRKSQSLECANQS
jgi:hypothetical protein